MESTGLLLGDKLSVEGNGILHSIKLFKCSCS